MENIQYSSLKFLHVYCEELRCCLTVLTAFMTTLKNDYQNNKHYAKDLQDLSHFAALSLYFINRLNHDTISQCTLITLIIDLDIFQVI